MIVAQNMCDRSHFPGDIESEALVWNGQVDYTPGTHDSEKRAQCSQRVLAISASDGGGSLKWGRTFDRKA